MTPKQFFAMCKKENFGDLCVGGRCANTIMHGAIYNNNLDLLRHLCRVDKDLLRTCRNDGMEPIHLAVSECHIECVAILLEYGAHINAYCERLECEGQLNSPGVCFLTNDQLKILVHMVTVALQPEPRWISRSRFASMQSRKKCQQTSSPRLVSRHPAISDECQAPGDGRLPAFERSVRMLQRHKTGGRIEAEEE
jgi:hypothetical protein